MDFGSLGFSSIDFINTLVNSYFGETGIDIFKDYCRSGGNEDDMSVVIKFMKKKMGVPKYEKFDISELLKVSGIPQKKKTKVRPTIPSRKRRR